MRKIFTALDIGSNTIKVVVGEFIGTKLNILSAVKVRSRGYVNNYILDKEALIKIATEPKNALVKQYQKLLEMDDVELEFNKEALEAIVDKAIERKTGARGLRSIIEEIMRDIMFDVPSTPDIAKCIITKETVLDKKAPELIIREKTEEQQKNKKDRHIPQNSKETA